MTQTWDPPVTTDVLSTAITQNIQDMLDSLRSCFAGASEPSVTTPYMIWIDTTNGQIKRRDAADSAWVVEGKLLKDHGHQVVSAGEFLSVSATFSTYLTHAHEAGKVKRIIIIPDTASSSSSGNEWQFTVQNLTTTNQLFSGTVGTFTTLGGVGGGEFAVDTAYVLTPDQNDTLTKDDVLEFTMTKVGTVTTIARMTVLIEYTMSE